MNYIVSPCKRDEIGWFIEKHHYSGNVNGVISDYCFKLLDGDRLIGAMMFGRLAMVSQWKKYGEHEDDVQELRRLVCVDDTEKNTESFFIGKCLNWLKLNTEVKTIVSYADPEYGHSGVIYRATNFKFVGTSSSGKVIWWNGKKYHDKTVRTKYKGKLKPFAQGVVNALETGEAFYKETVGKNIYIYRIRRSHNMRRRQPVLL